jgi:hypothetical protein
MTPRSVVLGCGQEHPRVAQLNPRPHGLGTEGREERADDDARLHRAERRGIEFRHAARQDEHPVPRRDAVGVEDMGEARGLGGEIGVGQGAPRAFPAQPDEREVRAVARRDVAFERLVGDVPPAARQSVEPRAGGVPSRRQPRLALASRALPDDLVVHAPALSSSGARGPPRWSSGGPWRTAPPLSRRTAIKD